MVPASDLDDHFVEMPARTGLRARSAKVASDQAAKLQEPAADCFVRSVDATLGQHFLNVAEGKREAGIKPDRMHDHRRWKAMTLE